MRLVTAAQMRELDRRTIDQAGVPSLQLMEAAGQAVSDAVRVLLPRARRGPVVIVAGKGNNGGDGLVVARLLHDAGIPAEVCLLPTADELSGDAVTNFQRARRLGVTIYQQAAPELLGQRLSRAAVVVDAVLGTGVSGEVRGSARDAIAAMNAAPAPVVAVDIPSGVDADTGALLGAAVRADITVTMGLPKVGLFQYPGRDYVGQVQVADIGIPDRIVESAGLNSYLAEEAEVAAMLPARPADMHKGSAGRLLVVAGSVGMTGAAALCALAAMRSGAGLVFLACPRSLNDILEVKCTEVLTRPLPQTAAHSLALAAEGELRAMAEQVDAVVLGPGLSQHPETAELVRRLARALTVPAVIDADGLNACTGHAHELAYRPAPTVITPHPGEMSRLTGRSIAEIAVDRPAAARALAAQTGAVVVLKGAGTVTCTPEGEMWINPTGNQALACGGTGDVLAGMMGAFLAGGAAPLRAAVAAVWYHGRAAEVAAPPGRRGLLASDLLDVLPELFPKA